VEPITYPGYTVAMKKRKRKERKDSLDKTVAVGRFAVIDLQNDDQNFKLRLCLGRISKVHEDYIEFDWYTYSGYPKETNPTYQCTWVKQILAGRGQKIDTGWCPLSAIVLTFAALTKGKKIPNNVRDAPLKMILRALKGEFGPLPEDDTADGEYQCSSSESDDSGPVSTRVTRSGARGKRRCKQ
jgi:hypothetical protein